jgi:hypothetical protein
MKMEVKDFVGGKFRAITQVSCVLLLALSLSLVTAVSVMAVEFPSISPTTAEYDLDDPAEVITTITWGIASEIVAITDDEGNLTAGLGNDYIVLGEHLIIFSTYLEDKFTDIGESVVLIIKFDAGAATFTITATGTQPSISPTTAQYNLQSPANVKTVITLGTAASVVSIVDNDKYTLAAGTHYNVTDTVPAVSANLTILGGPYLASKLKDIGDKVVLTIKFNLGANATFTITATGTQPSISPTTGHYNIDSPANVKTAITLGTATLVVSIVDDDKYILAAGTHYNVTDNVPGVSANLTILGNPYLAGKLTDIGDKVVLTIDFNVGANATFTITATGTQPSISPQTKEYDLDSSADAKTTITWGTATSVVSIVDDDKYTLEAGTHYNVADNVPGVSANLTILGSPYLAGKLTDIGDKVVLTIDFNLGANATFTITATGTQPSISPTTAQYNLQSPANVKTTITWGTATSVVSIVDDNSTLVVGKDYTVTDTVPGVSANLTIRSSPYLVQKLGILADNVVVLTIGFDVGRDATLTINRASMCFIATAAYGTPMAEEVQILREFRDKYLLTNPLGQALVDFYYRVSPPIAEFITEHPSLKPIVRVGLMPAVAMGSIVVNTNPAEKIAIVGLIILVLVAVAIWTAKQKDSKHQQ